MAIVIPVAMQGLRIAALAGQVGQCKITAARLAERVLNEMVVTGQASASGGRGILQDNGRDYEWTIQTTSWPEDTMQLVTVQVVYQVQGRPYDVHLSTLVSQIAL